jgi:hypothetical protein
MLVPCYKMRIAHTVVVSICEVSFEWHLLARCALGVGWSHGDSSIHKRFPTSNNLVNILH